jgi:hypothetical protein
VGHTPRWGNLTVTPLFQPFPLEFGEWERLDVNRRYQKRDRDGFVVATIQHAQDGNRGYIIGRQTVGTDLAPCAASSMHVYDHSDSYQYVESFCMPVVEGNDFQVDYTPTAGNPTVTAYWIAMGASHKMLPMESRDLNKTNRAERNGIPIDGILFGYLQASRGEARNLSGGMPIFLDNSEAMLNLKVSDSEASIDQGTIITRTTVQYTDMGDKLIPYNSATAVVRKGSYYKAEFVPVEGSVVGASIKWVGIVPA